VKLKAALFFYYISFLLPLAAQNIADVKFHNIDASIFGTKRCVYQQ
jgi:hypothetical protein